MEFKVLLQNIQDAFAEQLQMTVMITDHSGRAVTSFSHLTPFSEKIIDSLTARLMDREADYNDMLLKLHRPFILDASVFSNYTGLKFIVAPIKVNGKTVYYVWAGIIVEQLQQELIAAGSQLTKEAVNVKGMNFLQIEEKLIIVEKLSATLEQLVMLHEERQVLEASIEMASSLEREELASSARINKSLEGLFKIDRSIDFAVYAKHKKDNTFKIVQSRMNDGQQLKSLSFSIEGTFLQEAVETRRFQVWHHVSSELQSFFLHNLNIRAKSLFCIPIIINKRVDGIFFGGSESSDCISPFFQQYGVFFSSIMTALQRSDDLVVALDRQLMKIASLMEMGKAMNHIEKIDELLHMLADVALQMIQGDFCFVFLQNGLHAHKVKSVSMPVEKLLSEMNLPETSKGAKLLETKWGTVLLHPLTYDDVQHGMIVVHLNNPSTINESEVFLHCLAQMGSAAISNMNNKKSTSNEDLTQLIVEGSSLVETLTTREIQLLQHLIMGYTNREIADKLFISVHTVKNHITNIFQKLGVSDRSHLIAMVYQLNTIKY